jgi:dolichol kinase
MDISTIALLALTPLLVWRIYSRLKAMMVRQRSIMQRHYTGALAFTLIAVVAAGQVASELPLLAWLAVGVGGGIAYGVWGLKLTRFETVSEGYFFTPNKRLGMAIAMLFVAAILYVGFEIYANQGSGQPTPRVTDYVFFLPSLGLMAGYFGTMSVGLLLWRRKLRKAVDAA